MTRYRIFPSPSLIRLFAEEAVMSPELLFSGRSRAEDGADGLYRRRHLDHGRTFRPVHRRADRRAADRRRRRLHHSRVRASAGFHRRQRRRQRGSDRRRVDFRARLYGAGAAAWLGVKPQRRDHRVLRGRSSVARVLPGRRSRHSCSTSRVRRHRAAELALPHLRAAGEIHAHAVGHSAARAVRRHRRRHRDDDQLPASARLRQACSRCFRS